MSPVSPEERIGVLEASVTDVKTDIVDQRQEMRDIKTEIHEIRTDLMLRPRREDSDAKARAYALAAASGTAVVSLVGAIVALVLALQ